MQDNDYIAFCDSAVLFGGVQMAQWLIVFAEGKFRTVSSETLTAARDKLQQDNRPHAVLLLGWMCHLGLGCNANFSDAMKHYKKAMSYGSKDVMQVMLYFAEMRMRDGKKDEAIAICEEAIKAGSEDALLLCAELYKRGLNYPSAIKYLNQSIELGNIRAMYYRIDMHVNGIGGGINYAAATVLFKKISEAKSSFPDINLIWAQWQIRQLTLPRMDYLNSIKFDTHLNIIKAKAVEMTEKAKTNPKYRAAAKTANELFSALTKTAGDFLSGGNYVRNQVAFKNICIKAIKDAKPTLEEHRSEGWRHVLVNMLNALVTGMKAMGMSCFGLYKTDSAKKLRSGPHR